MKFTVRKSLSSRGGYRGGCGAKEGDDLERRTPSFFHRLLLRGDAGCAWERTKVMDGSVGSGERILFSLVWFLMTWQQKDDDGDRNWKRGGGREKRDRTG